MGLKGHREHVARMKRLASPEMARAVSKALFVAADRIKESAQHSIIAGSVSGKNHVPSRPGEPPNADTRTLDKNIEATQPKPLTAEVSSKAPYAAALEFGTSKMEARPYMAPARDKHRKEAQELVQQAVNHVATRR